MDKDQERKVVRALYSICLALKSDDPLIKDALSCSMEELSGVENDLFMEAHGRPEGCCQHFHKG